MPLFPKTDWLGKSGVLVYDADSRYSLSANLVPASMPSSAVLDPDLSKNFRVETTARSRAFLEFDLGASRAIDAIGVVGVRPSSPSTSTRLRVLLSNQATDPFVQMLSPDAIATHANLANHVVGDVDEDPRAPDGNFGAASGGSAPYRTMLRVDFPTPSRAPRTGADEQIFEAAHFQEGIATNESWSDNQFETRENGALRGTATNFTSSNTQTEGVELAEHLWDADDLVTANGSNAEAEVDSPNGGTNNVLNVEAIAWFAALGSLVDVGAWKNLWPATVDEVEDSRTSPTWFHAYSSQQTARYVRIEIDTPGSWVDIDRVILGEKFQPATTFAMGHGAGVQDGTIVTATRSGQDYVDDGARKVRHRGEFRFGTRAEAHTWLEYFMLRKGLGGEVFFYFDDADTGGAPMLDSVYGRFESLGEMIHRTNKGDGSHVWAIPFTILERRSD